MVVVMMFLVLDGEYELAAALLAKHARVLPEDILFLLGHPPLDENVLRIL